MQCPACATETLDVRHSHGIEVDVCPECGGVWLERGELDKIMTQAQTEPVLGTYVAPDDPSTSSEEHVPESLHRRATDDTDADGEREEWKSDRRSFKRRAEDREHERSEEPRKSKKSKKSKHKSFGDRLEDILDDVLDLDDIFD